MAGDSGYRDGDRAGGLPAGTRVAAYRIEARAGSGGMAVVYRARDERLHRTVALKVLTPALAADAAFRQRFIREARAAAAVDHPHILPVYDADEADGLLFIAMRFVSGGDLQSLTARAGPLPPARAAGYLASAAAALDAAHAAGLVHRDVKPGNLLVDSRPGQPDHLYLSDFGLSRGVELESVTGPSVIFGTRDYISPEMASGAAVDGRSDQYALACTAFNLLAGTPVFQRVDSMAVLMAHISQPPPSLNELRPDLPAAAGQVIARALAKDPGDRYPSCGMFAAALTGALDPARSAAVVTSGPPPARASRKDRAKAAVLAAGADSAGRVPAQRAAPDPAAGSQDAAGEKPGAGGAGRRPGRRSPLLRPPVVVAGVIVLVGALVAAAVLLAGNSHRTDRGPAAGGAPSPLLRAVPGDPGSSPSGRPGKSPSPRATPSGKPPGAQATQPGKTSTGNPGAPADSPPASAAPKSQSDPTSQPPAATATAVTVGGAGPSSSGAKASNASTLSWNQTVSGSSPALLIAVAVGENPDQGMGASATDNGAAMTPLTTIQAGTQQPPGGFLEVFGLTGVADGTNTIKITVTGGPALALTGGSVFFDGATSFTTSAPTSGTSKTAAVTMASTSGGVVAAFAACAWSIDGLASPASAVQEFTANENEGNTGAGNSAGATMAATGGQVTVKWTAEYSDDWGAIAVEVK